MVRIAWPDGGGWDGVPGWPPPRRPTTGAAGSAGKGAFHFIVKVLESDPSQSKPIQVIPSNKGSKREFVARHGKQWPVGGNLRTGFWQESDFPPGQRPGGTGGPPVPPEDRDGGWEMKKGFLRRGKNPGLPTAFFKPIVSRCRKSADFL